jgi:hypothetical protein
MAILDFGIMYLQPRETTHSADDRGIDIEDDKLRLRVGQVALGTIPIP